MSEDGDRDLQEPARSPETPSLKTPSLEVTPAVEAVGRRRLRAVFAADVAGFSSRVSVEETRTFDAMHEIRQLGRDKLDAHGGWLFGMPGDGLFALFESAIDAVNCAMAFQDAMRRRSFADRLKVRIGVHLGEVMFQGELPFGEALAIAARLESLAEPGGVLVSNPVVEAVSARVAAIFEDRGAPPLKNIPRRIRTFAVMRPPDAPKAGAPLPPAPVGLDRTMQLSETTFRKARIVFPQEDLATLAELLAGHIGPIARVVVERAQAKADTMETLALTVAKKIPLETERRAFVLEAARLFAERWD